MKWHKQILWIAFSVLANCGSGLGLTEFGKRVDQLSSLYANKYNKPMPYEDATQLAVYDMSKGLTREDAKEILEADGASCHHDTCTWRFTTRLSNYERMFSIIQPELPKGWNDYYSVTFATDRIENINDIIPNVKTMEPLE